MFQNNFSQDDFIHLWSSKADSFGEVLNFFNPFAQFEDIFFYRPLATQFYFFVTTSMFGQNPLAFHIIGFLLHLINTYLFYKIVRDIWSDNLIAKLSAVLFGFSAVHFLSLYYISAFQQLSKTFFIFLAILLFRRYYYLSLICFVLALLSKETAIILPFLISLIELLKGNFVIKRLIPFFGIAVVYLLIRLVGFQTIFTKGAYEIDPSLFNIWQNLKWDVLWIFGLPEIISSTPSLRPDLIISFMDTFTEGSRILVTFIGLIILIAFGSWSHLKEIKKFQKQIIIGGLILLLPIVPTLPLKGHNYPHYLDLSLLIFLPLVIYLVKSKKVLLTLTVLAFLTLQFFSYQLSERTHWTTHRSKVASHYEQLIKKDAEQFNEETTIILEGDPNQVKEVYYALAGKYAIYVWTGKQIKNLILLETAIPGENVFVYQVTKF